MNPEISDYIYVINRFLTRVPRSFNRERIVFSTNGAGTTIHMQKNAAEPPSSHCTQKVTRNDSQTWPEVGRPSEGQGWERSSGGRGTNSHVEASAFHSAAFPATTDPQGSSALQCCCFWLQEGYDHRFYFMAHHTSCTITRMHEKLQVREFLQDYKIVMNRTAGGKYLKTLDCTVLKVHSWIIIGSLSESIKSEKKSFIGWHIRPKSIRLRKKHRSQSLWLWTVQVFLRYWHQNTNSRN